MERRSEPAPRFEPPADPGEPPARTLAARIVTAPDADGTPPLDADQVLDLQRSAGNRLTTGALARWTEPLD
jgi:hypothetical protein